MILDEPVSPQPHEDLSGHHLQDQDADAMALDEPTSPRPSDEDPTDLGPSSPQPQNHPSNLPNSQSSGSNWQMLVDFAISELEALVAASALASEQ